MGDFVLGFCLASLTIERVGVFSSGFYAIGLGYSVVVDAFS